jgi:hypothetical protein
VRRLPRSSGRRSGDGCAQSLAFAAVVRPGEATKIGAFIEIKEICIFITDGYKKFISYIHILKPDPSNRASSRSLGQRNPPAMLVRCKLYGNPVIFTFSYPKNSKSCSSDWI